MKTRMLALLMPGLLLICTTAWTQGFVTPLTSITGSALLTTIDGREVTGDLKMALFGPAGIMSLTIKDSATGEKARFKAEEVSKLRVKIDGLAKLEMLGDKTSNLKKFINADFNEIVDRKFAYYEQVKIPGKEKFVLTQLLNPGFDSKIRVFDKPMAKTGETSVGGISLSGGEARAYFVVARGVTTEITRGRYSREFFGLLFGDCPELVKEFPDPKFQDFASHVWFSDRVCH